MIITGRLDSNFPGYDLKGGFIAFISISLIVAFYLFLYLSFQFGTRIKNRAKIKIEIYNPLGLKKLTLIVISLQLIFIYAILVEGTGLAGGVVNNSQTIISSLLAIFRVDDFALLFMLCYTSSRYFGLNFGLYFISFILRGWLSVVISGFIIVLYKYKIRIRSLKSLSIGVCALMILAFGPFLLLVRNDLRLSGDYFDAFKSINYSEIWKVDLIAGINGILMRFQQLDSLIYLIQNLSIFQNLYDHNLITPVYFDGPILSTLFKQFNQAASEPLGLVLADQSRVLAVGRKSAVSPGLITYFLLDSLSALYIIIIPVIYGFATTFFPRSSRFSVGCFYFLIFYYSFGWSNAVVGSIFTIFVFIFTCKIIAPKIKNRWR